MNRQCEVLRNRKKAMRQFVRLNNYNKNWKGRISVIIGLMKDRGGGKRNVYNISVWWR